MEEIDEKNAEFLVELIDLATAVGFESDSDDEVNKNSFNKLFCDYFKEISEKEKQELKLEKLNLKAFLALIKNGMKPRDIPLSNVSFHERAYFMSVDFRGADLKGTNLSGCFLMNAKFDSHTEFDQSTNLQGAHFFYPYFNISQEIEVLKSLSETNISNADLDIPLLNAIQEVSSLPIDSLRIESLMIELDSLTL